MKFIVQSKGLHTTWLLAPEHRSLFDCGENASSWLGYRIFIPERIFLSHSHIDHVAGLPAFIGLRSSTKGANDKPLHIYYPQGNRKIEEWLQFSIGRSHRHKFQLEAHPLRAGEQVPLPMREGSQERRYVQSFAVQHASEPCFGYRVVSVTRKLKPEFRGKTPEFYKSLTPAQKTDMSHDDHQVKFLYTGDAMPLRSGPECPLNGAEVAFLDCTFLRAADREAPTHAAMEEIAGKCALAGVKTAYAMHLSIRYTMEEIRRRAAELQSIYPLKLVPHDQILCIE